MENNLTIILLKIIYYLYILNNRQSVRSLTMKPISTDFLAIDAISHRNDIVSTLNYRSFLLGSRCLML